MDSHKIFLRGFILQLLFVSVVHNASGQTELQAWGNITGIRVQGELMAFESGICIKGKDWTPVTATGKERQSPKFSRSGNSQTVLTKLGNINFTETVTDLGPGSAMVNIRYTAIADTMSNGIFFSIQLPLIDYAGGTIQLDRAKSNAISTLKADQTGIWLKNSVSKLKVSSVGRQLKIRSKEPLMVFVREGSPAQEPAIRIYFQLQEGNLRAGDSGEKTFTINATGPIDKKEIRMELNAANPGRAFAGFGGNFRIQNIMTDPQVIDYCLNNLRVAWGRVEMPWRFWQPEKNIDPVAAAKAGHLDAHVQRAMEMAQKLQQRGIPIILTDWSAPDWAIIGKPVFQHRHGEPWGNPLNPDSIMLTYKSIADYIQYLQDQYGVEVKFFSFNESDLGIYIRQTGEEHDELIKGLGKYFISRGLKTKLLLGDNSDATTYTFINPALKDTSSHGYIGAVSFHSWRGWETEILNHWTEASKEINLPLIVGEGSIDAAAWAYPDIFLEQTYAMQEISLYVRLMAICQPLSILQWQLTSDYSPLTGGGIFGHDGPLTATHRFWNLKQLASTPAGLNYLPVSCDRPAVTCAALGNARSGKYSLHLVNNGAERKVILSGIPGTVRSFNIYSTSKTSSMQEGNKLLVKNGTTSFDFPAGTYVTLISQ